MYIYHVSNHNKRTESPNSRELYSAVCETLNSTQSYLWDILNVFSGTAWEQWRHTCQTSCSCIPCLHQLTEFQQMNEGKCSSVRRSDTEQALVNGLHPPQVFAHPVFRSTYWRSWRVTGAAVVLCAARAVHWRRARTTIPSIPSGGGKQSCQTTSSTPFRQQP